MVLVAFTNLRKATNSFVMSVCPSVWISFVPTGWILMKFNTYFSKIYLRYSGFVKNVARKTGILHEY